jgi:hypothetical protein
MEINIPMRNQSKTQKAVFVMLAPVAVDTNWPVMFTTTVSKKFMTRNSGLSIMAERKAVKSNSVENWDDFQDRQYRKMTKC